MSDMRPRGMTLIELMVVIAIIGVLAAIATPELIRLVRRSKIVGDARELQSVLKFMQSQAVTRGLPMVACLRGNDFSMPAEGPGSALFTFRKGTPLNPVTCVAQPCASPNVPPATAAFNAGATPPDVPSIGMLLSEGVTWTLPGTNNQETFQLVFDAAGGGRVTAFRTQQCRVGAAGGLPTRVQAIQETWTVQLQHEVNANISQNVIISANGTVTLP